MCQDAFVPERWVAGSPKAATEAERKAWMAFGDGAFPAVRPC